MKSDDTILVCGGTGMLGHSIISRLLKQGYNKIISTCRVKPEKKLWVGKVEMVECDLTSQAWTRAVFDLYRPDYVFLCSALVGGISSNINRPAEFISTNLSIQTNVIQTAYEAGVSRLLFMGSSCIYPRRCPQPMKEEYLLTGPLEPTNEFYAIAKIAGVKMCEAFWKQYRADFFSVMAPNLYGPRDHYDIYNCHVVPAMIRKFHLGKLYLEGRHEEINQDITKNGMVEKGFLDCLEEHNSVLLWGDGSPLREILFIDDCAEQVIWMMNHFFDLEQRHINIGSGECMSIRTMASIIAEVVGYKGLIKWGYVEMNGMMEKRNCLEKSQKSGNVTTLRSMENGVKKAYEDYLKRK